jgi:hypothetical protein
MWTPIIVLELLLVWVVIFLIALLPAIWAARLIARKWERTADAVIVCLTCAILFSFFVATFLIVMKFDALPHVRAERASFAIFFSGVVFGVPAFAALLVGLKRAGRNSAGVC